MKWILIRRIGIRLSRSRRGCRIWISRLRSRCRSGLGIRILTTSLLTMRGWGCDFDFWFLMVLVFHFDLRFFFFSFRFISFFDCFICYLISIHVLISPLAPSACEPVFFLSLFLSFLYVHGSCALFPSSPFT